MVSEIVTLFIGGEGIEREDFRRGFQRVLNRVPRRGSTTKPEFFSYFFLGAALTLPYTKLNDEIDIQASSVKITSKETIKLAFRIEEDGKTKLVFRTIAAVKKIQGEQHLTIDELKEALGSLDLTQEELSDCEVKGEIVHIKDGKVNLKTLEVIGKGELNSKTLKEVIGDHGTLPEFDPGKAKFKKVKDGIIEKGSLNNALEQFSQGSLGVGSGEKLSPSSKGAGAFFENLAQVYRSERVLESDDEDAAKRKLGLSDYEAPIHGLVYGTLAMNFRYEYALRIRPEQAAGKGFVDLVVGSNGREFRVELKGHKNTAQNAKLQSEKQGYDKAPIIFSFGEEQKAKSVTMVFANLCLDPSLGGLLVEKLPLPPKPEGLIELFNKHSGESLKEKLKEKLNYLYYSISDSNGGGENTNYLSRLVLGESLTDDTLEKRVFIYEGNHIKPGSAEHDTRSGKAPEDVTIPMNKVISTFVLKVKGDKYVILNIIEGEDFRIEKSIPLNGLGIDLSKCTQVNIKVNPKANGGFEVESDPGKSYYQGIEIGEVTNFENKYKGEFKTIEYVSLQDITDITQVRGFQEALFPLRKLITLENHFQAILQGLLSVQKGVEVLTEPNYSSRGKPDLMVSYDGKTGVVEVKLASTERDIERKRKEGETQLEARGDGLEVYTKEEKVTATVLVICPSAGDKNKFITHFRAEDLTVGHSSRGSSDGEPPPKKHCSGERRKRSIGMTCVDSLDEESLEEQQRKEELVKELFDTDEIKKRIENIELYDQLFKVSDEISKEVTINEDTRKALMEKIKDIDLNSIDPEIKEIVGEIKRNLIKGITNEGLKTILGEFGIAERIVRVAEGEGLYRTAFLTKENRFQEQINRITSNPEAMNHLGRISKISGWTTQGMMYKNLIGDILSGDLEGVAINLGFIAGSPLLSKMAEAASVGGLKLVSEGKVFLGRTLGMASPFLARTASAFVVYDLVNQIKKLKAGDKDALVVVIGDSIYLSVDVVEIGIELADTNPHK
ncbi:PD-(D/E)XK nuclease domain-containing protein [Wolbachia endosymbiont of Oedothorax gibbosus]|uniref:PD-(D/E)XK nuclease domain-containing protein n=1 Tax=Wolbachia endosymbiont of Oedothorax gibbosus TaxID=931100 RepID=UPI0020242B45|nr:PD-(D/E)XK nuclease domain-containing protein [Wolbachia endosymbiont of Oedothorax gibbosus]